MRIHLDRIPPLLCCSLCSVLAHLLLVSALGLFREYRFGAAVAAPPAVMVDLAAVVGGGARQGPELPGPKCPAGEASALETQRPGSAFPALSAPSLDEPEPLTGPAELEPVAGEPEPGAIAAEAEPESPRLQPGAQPAVAAAPQAEQEGDAAAASQASPASGTRHQADASPAEARLKALGAFLAASQEKLSYVITMHGMPIGSAQLESRHDQGITTMTLKVKSNAAISSVFPVDNEIETRHIDGRFIMTKIRQREGSFTSDESFTINLGKKRVTWAGLSTPSRLTMAVPTDEVLDTLSGIYYLRTRSLQVGRTETLHIYDSESYAEVPVEILRREHLRLANLTRVDTLVVRPQEGNGIFRRTGDVLIWMTDDERRVPVKITTSIALGRVSAELVSAESEPHAEAERDL